MNALNSKLFVRNLSWSVTEDELTDLFADIGEVRSVSIPTRREDGKPRGFAFVEMLNPDSAQQAIRQLNGYALHSRDLVVDFQDENRGKPSYNRNSGYEGGADQTKLFVRHIPFSVSEEELQSLFQNAGTVVSVKIPTDYNTGEPKGFAFVEMGSAEDGQQAVQSLNHTMIHGQEISVGYQDPNRSRKSFKPGGGGGYARNDRGGGYRSERSGGYANRNW